MVNWMVQYSIKALPSSTENCTVHYMTMAAPSRHISPGNAVSNPHVQDDAAPVLTNYELARERRKKELHERVELAYQSSGIILDLRVRAAFTGQSPTDAARVVLRIGSGKRSAGCAVPGEAKSPILRVVRRSQRLGLLETSRAEVAAAAPTANKVSHRAPLNSALTLCLSLCKRKSPIRQEFARCMSSFRRNYGGDVTTDIAAVIGSSPKYMS
jgi:hypothetical protein